MRRIAGVCGWQEVQFNHDSRVIGFVRGVERVNVYYTTGTVGTCIDHPRRGQTQLFRRNQSMHDLAQIFNNPRVHTSECFGRDITRATPGSCVMLLLLRHDGGDDDNVCGCLKPLTPSALLG